MHPRHFVEQDRPSDAEVEAAARELNWWGCHHGWLKLDYDQLDLIGKEAFDAIVERILRSAAATKRGVPPNA